jgi:hypothetical protein
MSRRRFARCPVICFLQQTQLAGGRPVCNMYSSNSLLVVAQILGRQFDILNFNSTKYLITENIWMYHFIFSGIGVFCLIH